MRDVHLRRVLEHSLGADTHVVVAKFANYGAIVVVGNHEVEVRDRPRSVIEQHDQQNGEPE